MRNPESRIDNSFGKKLNRLPTLPEQIAIGGCAIVAILSATAAQEIDNQEAFQEGHIFIVKKDTECLTGPRVNLVDGRTGETVAVNTIVNVKKNSSNQQYENGFFRGEVPNDNITKIDPKTQKRYTPYTSTKNKPCWLPTHDVAELK